MEPTSELVGDREIVLSRIVGAPRDLVWRAWTEPDRVAVWWGPDGFTTTVHEMDVRPGGLWRYTMHAPDGTDYGNRILYREVVAPERLTYLHGDDPEDLTEWRPFEGSTTFAERDGGTVVTLHLTFPTAEARAEVIAFGAVELGHQTLACLAEYLAAP